MQPDSSRDIPMPPAGSSGAPKRSRLFKLGLAGIGAGVFCCLLGAVALILSGSMRNKAAPANPALAQNTLAATAVSTTPPDDSQIDQPTPTLKPAGPKVTSFLDDFSNSDSGWYVGMNDAFRTGYTGDAYRIGISKPRSFYVSVAPDPFSDPVQNIIIGVRAKLAPGDKGSLGLVCGYQDKNNFYVASISDGQFSIRKLVKGKWTYLTDPQLQPLIDAKPDQDGYLSIGLSCIDSFIVLDVSGTGQAHVTDDTFPKGDIGLFVYGSDKLGAATGYYAQGDFDDFSARLP